MLLQTILSGQIIATSHDLTPKGNSPYFRKFRLVKYYNLARYFDSYHYKFGMNHCQFFFVFFGSKKVFQNLSRKGPSSGLNQHHFQPMLTEGSKLRSDPQTEPGAIWNRFRSTSYVFLVRLTWGRWGPMIFKLFFFEKGWPNNHQLDFLYSPEKTWESHFFLGFWTSKNDQKRGLGAQQNPHNDHAARCLEETGSTHEVSAVPHRVP